jgi:dTDP-4-dehydrorhamnose 3,5-epimerase-like enzyme
MTVKSVKFIKNKIITNQKGDIIKYINKNSKYFSKFGEAYFSELKINQTKGWNIHYKYQCILAVPFGKIIFSFFNPNSKKKKIIKITISKKNNYTIIIPSGIWFSFKSLTKISIVTNILNNIHDNEEMGKSNNINGIKIK